MIKHAVTLRKKLYRGFSIDAPWPENGGGKIKRGADKHFATLSPKRILAAIQDSGEFRPAEHAHVYLWVTNNFLEKGLWLMRELGVDYKTQITWPKERIGLGQYFRGQTEHILFGVVGKGLHPTVNQARKDLSTLLKGAQHSRVHSRKPEAAFELIEARTQGPYLEMFCDHALPARPNWDRWGLPRYTPEQQAEHAQVRRDKR